MSNTSVQIVHIPLPYSQSVERNCTSQISLSNTDQPPMVKCVEKRGNLFSSGGRRELAVSVSPFTIALNLLLCFLAAAAVASVHNLTLLINVDRLLLQLCSVRLLLAASSAIKICLTISRSQQAYFPLSCYLAFSSMEILHDLIMMLYAVLRSVQTLIDIETGRAPQICHTSLRKRHVIVWPYLSASFRRIRSRQCTPSLPFSFLPFVRLYT